QPLPAGSQLLPAGVPSVAGLGGWLAAPAAGAPTPGAPAPGPAGAAGPAGEPGAPAFAAGVNDGAAGTVGAEGPVDADGENLGILAAAVACEAADEPWAGIVAVGADSDGVGPKSSASKRRSRPSGGATSGAATVSGSQISAVRPPA